MNEENMNYLLIANVCVWLGVAGYVLVIAMGQKKTEARINQLEILQDD
jgi:CcmD family protein